LADLDSSPYTPVERQVYFGWHWDALDSFEISIATKADNAKIDLSLWNVGGDAPGMEEARRRIRDGLHQYWVRRVTLDAAAWFASQCSDDSAEQMHDLEALLDCIERCRNSSWWEWDDGSSLIFF